MQTKNDIELDPSRLVPLIDSLWEVSKSLVELVARICDQHPRLAHLARYAKKGRARKKNVHRLVAFIIEELKR
jgi:hypothetical protein